MLRVGEALREAAEGGRVERVLAAAVRLYTSVNHGVGVSGQGRGSEKLASRGGPSRLKHHLAEEKGREKGKVWAL